MWWLGWLACAGSEGTPTDTGAVAQQGIVVEVRSLLGERLLDAVVRLGGVARAEPDSAGLVYFLAVPPGRTPVWAEQPDTSVAHGAPQVEPDRLATARVVPAPLTWSDLPDASAGGDGERDGVTVSFPAGAIDGAGPWRLGLRRATPDEAVAVPGDAVGLRADDDLGPIALHEAFAVRGTDPDGEDLVLVTDARAAATVALPAGSPLRDPGAVVRLYQYSGSRAYWVYAGDAQVDPASGRASFEVGGFGWFGLGLDDPARTCVTGRLVDAGGAGITGAEVRLVQDGRVAPDRATSLDGAFCLAIDVGGTGTLTALGFDATLSTMWTAERAVVGDGPVATCAAAVACADLGAVPVERWPDADGDRAFAGPGGDCDDEDPSVGPSPALGDGSWCGGGS